MIEMIQYSRRVRHVRRLEKMKMKVRIEQRSLRWLKWFDIVKERDKDERTRENESESQNRAEINEMTEMIRCEEEWDKDEKRMRIKIEIEQRLMRWLRRCKIIEEKWSRSRINSERHTVKIICDWSFLRFELSESRKRIDKFIHDRDEINVRRDQLRDANRDA